MGTAEVKDTTPLSFGEIHSGGMETVTRQQPAVNDVMGGGNLDKVREILFGSQMRELEKRCARLEERLVRAIAEMREDLKKTFESLEGYVKRELESLNDRLKGEENERTSTVKDVAQELKEFSKTAERKLTQLDEQATKNARELRQQILDQSKSLTEDVRQRYADLSAVLDRTVQELRTDKTDRTALAALFTEVAMRLTNEFRIPNGD